MRRFKMSKDLKEAVEYLTKEKDRIEKNLIKKGKPRNLKDGEETTNNIYRREINIGLKLLRNDVYRQIIMALTIVELTGGFCPKCQDKPIDPTLLKNLYFPFCKLCVKDFRKKPEARKKFLKKKIEESAKK